MDLNGLTVYAGWNDGSGQSLAILEFTSEGTFTILSKRPGATVSDVIVLHGTSFITASNTLFAVQTIAGRRRVRVVSSIVLDANLGPMKNEGNRLYVATVTADSMPGIQIVDISDPLQMRTLGAIPLDSADVPPDASQTRFDVNDGMLFIALRNGGMSIHDVSNPSMPQQISVFQTDRWHVPLNVTVQNQIAYLVTSRLNQATFENKLNLYVVRISNPRSPRLLARLTSFDRGDFFNGMVLKGPYLFGVGGGVGRGGLLSFGSGKLYIFDVSNSSVPRLLSKSYTGKNATEAESSGYAEELVVENETAYIADGLDGVTVFSLKNPAQPSILETFETPFHTRGLSLENNRLHVVDSSCYLVYPIKRNSISRRN